MIINGLELIKYRWFTARGTVGIVLCKNKFGEEKAYIAAGKGYDEKQDLADIMMWGASFPVDIAKQLLTI